jgi:hypothetical protein
MCSKQMRILYPTVFKLNVNKIVKERDNRQLKDVLVHFQQRKCCVNEKKK